MPKSPATIADHLRRIRFDRKWAQVELARELGIHQSSLSRLEAGKTHPRRALVRRIEALLKQADAMQFSTAERIAHEVAASPEFRAFLEKVLSAK